MLTVLVTIDEPDHSSDAAEGGGASPAKANDAVEPEVAPDPPRPVLAVDKSATSTQLAPFHSSVNATIVVVFPPKTIVALFVPAPAKDLLAEFMSLSSVQLVPFQLSVLPVVGDSPPEDKAAV